MRFLLSTLLIAAFGFLAGLYLEWWSIGVVAFVVCLLIPQKPGYGFLAGFLGIFILWALVATWIDISNKNILSHKISVLLKIGGSSVLLILVTALVGGLVG